MLRLLPIKIVTIFLYFEASTDSQAENYFVISASEGKSVSMYYIPWS